MSTPTVPPSPVPTSINVSPIVLAPHRGGVVLEVHTPVGVAVYFLEAPTAKQLSAHLVNAAAMADEEAAGALIVPGSDEVAQIVRTGQEAS